MPIALVIALAGMVLTNNYSPVTAADRNPVNIPSLFERSSIPYDEPKAIHLASKVVGKVGLEPSSKYPKEYLDALSQNSIPVTPSIVGNSSRLQELISGADKTYDMRSPYSLDKYTTASGRTEFEAMILAMPSPEKISTNLKTVVDPSTNAVNSSTSFLFVILYNDTYYQIGAIYPSG